MKKFSKILSVALLVALVLSLGVSSAFAQTVSAGSGEGSITVGNAAMGEDYAVYKLFGATLGDNDTIAYTGTVPSGLTDYFEETSTGSGYVQAKPAAYTAVVYYTDAAKTTVSDDPTTFWSPATNAEMSSGLKTALTSWVGTQTTAAASATADGTTLVFSGLDLGYYVVTTSQGEAAISVDSTTPNVTVYDKNSTTIHVEKTVDGESYSIGDTITYTAVFDTINWYGEGEDANQVVEYTISDTLPEFLKDVRVTAIYVDADGNLTDTTNDQTPLTVQQFSEKKIVIPWATEVAGSNPKAYTSLYPNGAKLVITYTAVLTSVTNINAVDTNTVKIQPTLDNGEKPWDESWQDDAEIITYAAALKKTDGTNELAGATFKIKGLTVSAADENNPGVYTVVSYDPDPETTVESAELVTDEHGVLYILGIAKDVTLKVTEFKAPDGYNKLTDTVDMPAQVMSRAMWATSGSRTFDAKGNVVTETSTTTHTETVEKTIGDLVPSAVEVVNHSGATLPSTGGIGTTIFYVVGGVLVLAAIILLVTKKRMSE